MKPSKQESVSRRQSSILKTPKPRQPLQCVVANPSSSENSPTVKIKRRVSFAKNRRIRQFCNEAEQTVWDNTYEEHDSSHTKSSTSGSPDKPIIISVPSDDKENFPVQLFLKDNQLDCKEVSINVPIEEGDNLSQCDMEMDTSLINPETGNALSQNNESEFPNTTIYCDDGMDMTSYVPTNIIPCHTVSASLEDTALVSQTCSQDTSMEFTENIPCILSKNFNQEQQIKNGISNSTDLTQALSKLLGSGRLNKQTDNGIENTDTEPMEFTSILPSSTWIKPNTVCPYNENTENFSNKTMEFTAVVGHTNVHSNANNQKMNNKSILSERTEIFSNKSMEITEAVPVLNKVHLNNSNLKMDNHNLIQEKTEIFCNKSMETTEAISNYSKKHYSEEKTRILNTSMEMTEIPIHKQISANLHDTAHEKTKIFPNKSMEITEVVPAYNRNLNSHNVNSHVFTEKEDRTEVFYNKSMEMTEAVSLSNKNLHSENAKEKTRVFYDKSMEITETIPIHKIYQPGVDKKNSNRDEEKTTIFPNVSMEMTEAVRTNKFNKTDENRELQDKTKVFANKSMEMTDVVPVYRNINQINELNQDKTKIFYNKSMEITEPVYLRKRTDGGLQEKTEIFANKSMEITEVIPGGNRLTQFNTSMEITEAVPKNIQQLISQKNKSLHEGIENRTRMFANKSMEVTETVPVNPITSNIQKMQIHNVTEKTKIFHQSMDITEAIPANHKLFELQKRYMNEEKTENFINKSMDMTEAVPLNHKHFAPQELTKQVINEEKTEYFFNKSMDITQAISMNHRHFVPQELPKQVLNEEKTEHFINKSMDITEAIPMNHRHFAPQEFPKQILNEEKTEHFINKSMDITEAIPMNHMHFAPQEFPKQILNEEKTKHFINKSMDTTEAIPMNHRHFAPQEFPKQILNEERTEHFINKSMDITEAIPVNHRIFAPQEFPKQVLNEDKTEHFMNKSMDITEAIPMNHRHFAPRELPKQVLNEGKTEQFMNKSMDITEAIPVNHRVFTSKELSKQILNEERTEYFINNSMDMTESVPMQQNTFSNINDNVHNNLQKPRITSIVPVVDKTKFFTHKSTNSTEAVSVNANNFTTNFITQDKTKVFLDKSMDITETTPINQEVLKTKLNDQSNLKTHEKSKIFMDNSMDMTEVINEKINEIGLDKSKISKNSISDINSRPSLPINTEVSSKFDENNISALSKDYNFQSNNQEQENYFMNNNSTSIDQDVSMEMTSRLPVLQTVKEELPPQTESNSDKYRQTLLDRTNKEYLDICMDDNEPAISSFSKGNTKQLQSSTIQRNLSSRANTEESKFHRLTTDELHILCASLNLPTQKAEKEQSVIPQNTQNFITDCNDVNVLLDSLKNKSIFQKSNALLSEGDKSCNLQSEVNSEMCCDSGTEKKNLERTRLKAVVTEPSTMDFLVLDKSAANKSGVSQNDFDSSKTNVLSKTMTIPVSMETDRTTEISLKPPELMEISCTSTKVIPEINSMNKNGEFAKDPLIFNHEVPQRVEMTAGESVVNTASPAVEMSDRNSKVQPYIDISMEFSSTQPTSSSVKRKSSEINQSPLRKKNYTLHTDRSVHTLESMNSTKENSNVATKENSLCRLPSDSTDVLVATMGFKAELPHPLIINEKTTITVSTKSTSNKTFTIGVNSSIQSEIPTDKTFLNKVENPIQAGQTFIVNKMENQIELNCTKVDQKQQEDENMKQTSEIPVVESNIEENEKQESNSDKENEEQESTSDEENEEQESNSDEENKEPRVRESLFPDHYSEELEEIQPPSFLDSDSIVEESLDRRKIHENDLSDSVLNNSNKQLSNSFLMKEENNVILDVVKKQDHSSNIIRRLSNVEINPPEEIKLKIKKHSKKKKVKEIKDFEESPNKEIVVPLTPFESLAENIKAHEKRDDCIWSIRSLNSNMIAVDFISKSLIFVIRLNAFDVACNKDIENIQIISRLRSGTKNVLLKIVHNLLLAKLKPGELLDKYKMYEDVLPMLDCVSSEIIFAMDFKLDIERLNATNVFNIDEERISFMVASKKTNIILKVSLSIKVFNEIRANDVNVTCILGDIRKHDIKQLIVNIKKDSKFLSRYINDVRDYITLMEESTCLNKH